MFYKELNELDDKITEAIINNPKINQLAELKLEISDLENEISHIKYDTSRARDIEVNSKILSFLPEEEKLKYDNLQDEIAQIEEEINNLENQYQSIETKWYRTGPFGDEDDFENIVTIIDDKLKNDLEPKVKELREKRSKLFQELRTYQSKARNAYNIDADDRRSKSGLKDKLSHLETLKASKSKILQEVSEDQGFTEVFDFIRSEYKNIKLENAGISDKGIFVDVEISYGIELDDEDFDSEDYLTISDVDVADTVTEDLCIGDPFECDNSDSEFTLDLQETWLEGDPRIARSYDPGCMTLPNGDPGYPPSYDYEIDGELTGLAVVRITKIK